jgi:hypothetical protein
MAELILKHSPDIHLKDRDFQATPVGWAIHASENGWKSKGANYPETLKSLLVAGGSPPEKLSGTEEVQTVLREAGVKGF